MSNTPHTEDQKDSEVCNNLENLIRKTGYSRNALALDTLERDNKPFSNRTVSLAEQGGRITIESALRFFHTLADHNVCSKFEDVFFIEKCEKKLELQKAQQIARTIRMKDNGEIND